MTEPPITEPLLLERLAMDHDAFVELYTEAARQLGPRPFTPAVLEQALGYPWARPEHSYLLRGDEVLPLPDQPDLAGRHPLLAIGSNAAPTRLATKFAHHPAHEREVPVVAGWLHDHDVGAAAFPTAYGSMAATLVPSAGTQVRTALLWVTPLQFTQLTWSEFSYRLEHLEATFEADDGTVHSAAWTYASRWGALEGCAQAAIPARNRHAPARSQRELLAAYGQPEDVVRAIFEDFAAFITRAGTPAAPGSTSPARR